MQRPGREVITGTNLQLLLEMVLEREGLSSEAFRRQALECGRRGLTSLADELGRCRAENRWKRASDPRVRPLTPNHTQGRRAIASGRR